LTDRYSYPGWISEEAKDLINQLCQKDWKKRLGCGGGGVAEIQGHTWLAALDFGALERREVKPPFVPASGKDATDIKNFDAEFTDEPAVLTPAELSRIEAIDQREFEGFTFVNGLFKA
jgi:hypothetical protein